jgi:hypothetical protein
VVLAANDKSPEVILLGEAGPEGVELSDVVIGWDEIVDSSSIPATDAFNVTINGLDHEPAAVEFLLGGLASPQVFNADGLSFVQLELPPGVTWSSDDTVLVDYAPDATPIRDLGLGVAAGFQDFQALAWDVGGFDAIEPIVDSYHGADHLVLTFLHPLAPGPLPPITDFSVTVDGDPLDVLSVSRVHPDVGLGLVDLHLASAITDPDLPVMLHYVPGATPIVSAHTGETAGEIHGQALLLLAQTSVSETLPPGGTVSTAGADGPTVADPMFTTLTSPVGGLVEVEEVAVAGVPPAGFGFFGRQFDIVADPALDASDPLVLTFGIDASIIPDGEDHTSLAIFRNEVVVPACQGTDGAADPDPCVAERIALPDGDALITVLTTAASEWNMGIRLPFAFGGFQQPVDGGVPNIVNAGRAVPVRFSLGGDRGLDIFAPGSPSAVRLTSCDGLPAGDPIELTVTAGSSSLAYDAGTDTYTYVWKTARAWADSCRRLELSFADGSVASALFDFR